MHFCLLFIKKMLKLERTEAKILTDFSRLRRGLAAAFVILVCDCRQNTKSLLSIINREKNKLFIKGYLCLEEEPTEKK